MPRSKGRRLNCHRVEVLEQRLLLSTTWTVTSTADDGTSGTLRYAVLHSAAGDTIQFGQTAFAAGSQHTITLATGQLEIAHNLMIQGPGSATLSISGNNATRLFQIDPGVSASVSGMTLTNGNAGSNGGGAIYNNSGTLSLSNLLVTANTARLGGGVYTLQGTTTANSSTFSNNTASNYGGGFDCDSGTSATVTACTFNNNTAPVGGGILDYGISLNVINSTLTANSAGNGQGGAISNYQGTLTVTSCTIDANAASQGGGGIYSGAGSVALNNSIVAQNTTNGSASDLAGPALSTTSAYNLIGDGSGGLATTSGNLLGSTSSLLNPQLKLLGNYGGPTATMPPLVSSPVIDAGSNVLMNGSIATDQRGYIRIANVKIDMGAVEFGAAPASVPLIVNSSLDGVDYTPGKLTLRQAASLANALSGTQTITFDPTAFSQGANRSISLSEGAIELNSYNYSALTVTIQGLGNGPSVSGNGSSGLLQVDAGVTATLSGLSFDNGHATSGGRSRPPAR